MNLIIMLLLFSLKGFQKTIEPSKWVSSPKIDENRLWYTTCTSKIKMADEQKKMPDEKKLGDETSKTYAKEEEKDTTKL